MSNNIDLYIQEIEISKADIKGAIQSKGVTPTGGLSSYAEAILSIPTGTPMAPLNETITESGVYNYNPIDDGVGGYNSVEINVDIDVPTFETQSKEVTIKKNGTTSIVPDSGYDGLSEVNVTVQVSTGGSDKPQIMNGFRFTGGDIAQVDFSQYDWSMVYDTSEFFRNCTHSTGDWSNFEENFNGGVLTGSYMFAGVDNPTSTTRFGVSSIPNLGEATANVLDMSYIFHNNMNITDITPFYQWNTSNVTNATRMFAGSGNANNAPQISEIDLEGFGYPDGYKAYSMFYFSPVHTIKNIHPVGDVLGMFQYCSNLREIINLNTSKVTSMSYMFDRCTQLTSIPQLDTSNVTNMSYMFEGCTQLTSIPQMDTSKVIYMNCMFFDCNNLTSIPQMDVSKVTSVGKMFGLSSTSSTSKYKSLPDFNFMSLKNFGGSGAQSWVYNQDKNLESYGVIDCDSITDIGYVFGRTGTNVLTQIGGFRNLGKASSVSNTNSSYFMTMAPNLNYQSVLNVLNGLYDRASAGLSVLTLKLHANHLAMLSEDDIAIATNKGWTIS